MRTKGGLPCRTSTGSTRIDCQVVSIPRAELRTNDWPSRTCCWCNQGGNEVAWVKWTHSPQFIYFDRNPLNTLQPQWYVGPDLQCLGVDWRVSHSRHSYLGGQRVECPCVYTSGLTWTFLFLHTMLHLSRLSYMHYALICCTVMLLLGNFNMIFDSTLRASVRITKMSLPELTDGSIDTHKVVCCYGSCLLLWTCSTWLIYGVPCSFTPFWPSLLDCYVALYYFSQICKWHNPIDYYGNQLGKRDLLM